MATRTEAANGNGAQVDTAATEAALRRMAEAEPELAARLVIQSLPAAAAPLPSDLSWRLDIEGVGSYRVVGNGNGGAAKVEPALDGQPEDFTLETDAYGLARLAAGASPIGLVLRRKLRIRGRRRKALALRSLDSAAGPRELAQLGVPLDPDLVYRSLAYAIDRTLRVGAGATRVVERRVAGEVNGTNVRKLVKK